MKQRHNILELYTIHGLGINRRGRKVFFFLVQFWMLHLQPFGHLYFATIRVTCKYFKCTFMHNGIPGTSSFFFLFFFFLLVLVRIQNKKKKNHFFCSFFLVSFHFFFFMFHSSYQSSKSFAEATKHIYRRFPFPVHSTVWLPGTEFTVWTLNNAEFWNGVQAETKKHPRNVQSIVNLIISWMYFYYETIVSIFVCSFIQSFDVFWQRRRGEWITDMKK